MFKFARVTVLLAAALCFAAVAALAGDNATAKPATITGEATGVAVGAKAPNFTLKDTDGNTRTLKQYLDSGKTVVLHWFNPNCPFVVRHFKTYTTFTDLYSAYNKRNVAFIAINSTGPKHPQYGGDAEHKKEWSIQYPILLDPTGEVGKMYGAKTTPHTFVISPDGIVRYSGAIDNDPKDEKSAKEKLNYARQALDELLAGKPVSVAETRPYGCGVHYAE
jgi:peroxiredoxin